MQPPFGHQGHMSQPSSRGIKVKRNQGEQFRKALVEMGILDRCKKISSDELFVYLPLLQVEHEILERLKEISEFELIKRNFEPEPSIVTPESILGYSPSFEVIGDIAIVEPEDADKVASALLSSCKNLRSVITPISDVEGEFRTRRFKNVAGEERTFTIHKEHGLRYRVDLEGAYFTPRLGTERLRIATQVSPDDFVLDMFAGVGPFALLLAKRGAKVVAIDKNPVAVMYLRENAVLNKTKVEILEGDAFKLALTYENKADHVIMNLPHSAHQFLGSAIRAAKNGGVVHYYAISPEDDLYKDLGLIEAAADNLGVRVEVQYKGVVRSYAPHRYNTVIDFRLKKSY
jgi:tRNA (guanine37-N1)-methyltransferase